MTTIITQQHVKTVAIPDWLTGVKKECNIEDAAGFKIGQRVKRNQWSIEGMLKSPWNYKPEFGLTDPAQQWAHGVILDLHYEGENMLGGPVFTATVRWDNNTTSVVRTTLLEKKVS